MATIVLSAVGGAVGQAAGGGLLGLSAGTLGRAGGAMLGRALDQRLFGQGAQGSAPVEVGRLDRLRLSNAADGAAMARVYGRTRLGGQVIWATRFKEHVATSTSGGGGKGGGSRSKTKVRTYSYSISLAIALCEGEISRVGRIWADGAEVDRSTLNMRIYTGTRDQLPDPLIEAVEGTGAVPAYRGTAYLVIEDLQLADYGNRVPQFSFEVVRPAPSDLASDLAEVGDIARDVGAVALMPGTGEYVLATTPVHYGAGLGRNRSANVNSFSGQPDLVSAVETLGQEAPNCRATSLVVSWFGDDLRCGDCQIRPKVEQTTYEAAAMPWQVSGETRSVAQTVPQIEDAPVYGGTPTDTSVIEAIRHLRDAGQEVMFYPFILMEQLSGNARTDPWTGADSQPPLPWRGRITLSLAPTQEGSPDGTTVADDQVAAFFGAAQPGDFRVEGEAVLYDGPEEWSLRRFVLHYAHLCAVAGGVDAFCIGSEMRGLTQIRGADGFPAVAAFRVLAAEVRSILGPEAKLGYAADWSEYSGYQPEDGSGDRYFHLDPLWADPDIDFIGIDNYMPLSDWRDGDDHAEAAWGTIYNPDYLASNIAGGEGYDWYYPSDTARARQQRAPITDGAYGEPWVYRYKDIRGWWSNRHFDRIAGVRQTSPTAWEPFSKPVWFTEIGCAAIDRGTNQPNKFLDPKSSESALPYYSNGQRDEFIQMQYLRVMRGYWSDVAVNPVSSVYGAPMVDAERMFVWAWDARPYPDFPNHQTLWSDGPNYTRGHWITGRVGHRALASVVTEICASGGVHDVDVSQLFGVVRGYHEAERQSPRAALQSLMLTHGFDAIERDGKVVFVTRGTRAITTIDRGAVVENADGDLQAVRSSPQDLPDSVQLSYVTADAGFDVAAVQTVVPTLGTPTPSENEVAVVLTPAEARQITDRWLSEARLARETRNFALPPSARAVGAGDVVAFAQAPDVTYRVDRCTSGTTQEIEAVRVDHSLYRPGPETEELRITAPFVPPLPVIGVFMDLPLMRGDEVAHAPHIGATGVPWPGGADLYSSRVDAGYALNIELSAPATLGWLVDDLAVAPAGLRQRDAGVVVDLVSGELQSASTEAFLAGANVAAIGDGTPAAWEVIQFETAELIAPGRYRLTSLLRGQAGTDGRALQPWPLGSQFVLINSALEQMETPLEMRGQPWYLRIGPDGRAYDDAAYAQHEFSFQGNGLRPLSPSHLRARRQGDSSYVITWIRRTRVGGDSWDVEEVPLSEQSEVYRLRIVAAGVVARQVDLSTPFYNYGLAEQISDGATAGFRIEVAQVSDLFGAGDWTSLAIEI